ITLESEGAFGRLPDWSPDCTQIAFQSNLSDPDNVDIYVMSLDGGSSRRITEDQASE
ncbi:MAG: hypothetical protein GWN71_06455, partial [Gammaproteobacteria bacterium]|nr:hypothetical protein [Gemmatimonadota bacterium]NIU73223.1 hypothetical protein [Gammaproteobacteria bacterium]